LLEVRQSYGEHLERVAVVFHNGYFDYFALYYRFGLRVSRIADTMLLSRLLHGADEDHDLLDLAERYGLPQKGDWEFMKGVREPDVEQLARLQAYAINDVQITAGLADHLIPRAAERPVEMWAAEHSIKMFVERPFVIDGARVQAARIALENSIAANVQASGLDEKTVRSTTRFPAALVTALAGTGRTLLMKEGKKGPIPAIAKDDPQRAELMADPDPKVRALMAAKAAVSSAADARGRISRLEAMAKRNGSHGCLLHSYHRAVTGRFAGGDGFNVQNLKRDDGEHEVDDSVASCIRKALRAHDGMVLVSADAEQIEARVLSFLAEQRDLHDAFAGGRDLYSEFASQHLGREVRKPREGDSPERATELRGLRQVGKRAVLGLGYNMGVDTFVSKLRGTPGLVELFDNGTLSQQICARIVYGYREQYPRIPQFWKDCEDAVRQAMEGAASDASGMQFRVIDGTLLVRLRSGRDLVYPRIQQEPPTYEGFGYIDRSGVRQTGVRDRPTIVYGSGFNLYGGLIVENIVQGTARDLLIDVMYRVESAGFPVVHHCHDSVTVQVPSSMAKAAAEALIEAWRSVPGWARGLVLDAKAATGECLGEV
jgi:hypothetical protein